MEANRNFIKIHGVALCSPLFSHTKGGESFYNFKLAVTRKSGTVDTVMVCISERLLWDCEVRENTPYSIEGQVRTMMREVGTTSRLLISVFAKDIEQKDEEDHNVVELEGYVCKKPSYRKTPFGKEIGDLFIAVNRKYGKADYIPLIVWDRNSKLCKKQLKVGDKITITGRLQSRIYDKKIGKKMYKRVHHEISVVTIEVEA